MKNVKIINVSLWLMLLVTLIIGMLIGGMISHIYLDHDHDPVPVRPHTHHH